jgi:hypothetical protein
MPAEIIYPFIVHRCIDEYREKKAGDRIRYSKKHVLTHLLTGAQLAVFPNHATAMLVLNELKDMPIFLMPTFDLLTTHPDMDTVAVIVNDLKRRYAI